MTTINKDMPVMITGATGYVAGRIIEKLLSEGITVHAAVRQPDNKEKTKYLDSLAEKLQGEIKYFKSDLLVEGSYDKAAEGCEVIFHTASPFTLEVKDPQKQLIDPALKGTKNVLSTASKIETIKRVVLTSSCAAIYGDSADVAEAPNGILTEEVWNTTSSLEHNPYSYSKTLAEKSAWEIAEKQSKWDMVVINPSFVVGPGINPNATSETYNIFKQLSDGTMKSGAPHWEVGVIDVRDLAVGHYNAAFTPTANGRNIISAETSSFLGIAKILVDNFSGYPFPKKKAPKFLAWLFAPAAGMTRKMVSKNVGHYWKADNSKSIKELNMNYRSVEETVIDFFKHLEEGGVVKK